MAVGRWVPRTDCGTTLTRVAVVLELSMQVAVAPVGAVAAAHGLVGGEAGHRTVGGGLGPAEQG
jgi:hypothetical protein